MEASGIPAMTMTTPTAMIVSRVQVISESSDVIADLRFPPSPPVILPRVPAAQSSRPADYCDDFPLQSPANRTGPLSGELTVTRRTLLLGVSLGALLLALPVTPLSAAGFEAGAAVRVITP